MELLAYRERFPILRETTYLINHSLGAMPAEAGFTGIECYGGLEREPLEIETRLVVLARAPE